MDRPRVIAHADMDAFYASIEQRDHPELRGKPVCVGGRSNRGVVSAASYEAREYGIHSAMPSFEARRRCPHATFLRGSMSKYSAESKRIFEIFRRFTPAVEGLSLDEAFLDLTGSERLLGPARGVAERLRAEVREETQLAVSVGIAPVKMVAKIASALSKPDGLLEVPRDGIRAFLDPLPVGRLWGVGPVAQARLQRARFETVGDLVRADSRRVEALLGEWGLGVRRLARGQDVREVSAYREPVSMSEENTFGGDISDLRTLDGAILSHSESVARRLRRSGYRARTVVLKLKLARRTAAGPRGYPLLTRRVTLDEPTDDGDVLAREARALLRESGLQEPVRLLGVGTTNLESEGEGQLHLFEDSPERKKRRELNRALDQVRDRFGSKAVVRAGQSDVQRAALSLQIKHGDAGDEDEEEEGFE